MRSRKEFVEQWEAIRAISERYQAIKVCCRVLFAKSERQAKEYFEHVRRFCNLSLAERKKAVVFLLRHWDRLVMHYCVEGLPRTTNLMENVNKQLERRYKTIEAIQYTNLLVVYLRQKFYTDCHGLRKHLNGKSRLEFAKVKYL